MNWTTMRSRLVVTAAWMVGAAATAQTTSIWQQVNATNYWLDAASWDAGGVPNSIDAVAVISADLLQDTFLVLTNPATVNRLIVDDTTSPYKTVRIGAAIGAIWDNPPQTQTLTFAKSSGGVDPSLIIRSAAPVQLMSTVRVDNATLYCTNSGATTGSATLSGPLAGNGTLTLQHTSWSFTAGAVNSNFTGTIVLTDGSYLCNQKYPGVSTLWGYGDTNGATYIYDSSQMDVLRDGGPSATQARMTAEPIHLYGMNALGSLNQGASSNTVHAGQITLHTNGVFAAWKYYNNTNLTWRQDVTYAGPIVDDGQVRNVHFLLRGGNSQAFLTNARMSRIVYSGAATYGGYTHVSNTRGIGDDATQGYVGWLQVSNGNDRLPVGTTVYLGGLMNDTGVAIGANGANGVLELLGANQELAGLLVVAGAGSLNRVIGAAPTNNMLTLNIATGTTNVYAGHLGGLGGMAGFPDDPAVANNLSLTKKGAGMLTLAGASNTYVGTTTVEAGTLRVNGGSPSPGAITVKNSGTLIMNGDWRNSGLITVDNGGTLGGEGQVGSISSSGTVAPGNSPGTLTSHGDVTLSAGATLQIEINEFLGDDYDKLVLSGGTLSLSGSPDLAITVNYLPGMGDAFTIVSGMTGFDPGFDGTFSGKPDLGTFDVSGTTFQIDYSATDITLTVVPEPHTLGLLGLAALGGLLRCRIRGCRL